ncbi:MAG: class I SAM-dependent methyltransferase [Sarcina sp.]
MSYLFRYYSKQYDGFMKLFKLDKTDKIIEYLGELKNKKVIDIGGGTGTLAAKLVIKGANVTIVDPEKNMTNIAKTKNNKINVLNEYSNKISLDSGEADVIIIRDAFHHILQKEETLSECKRLLKKNGIILICEFDKNKIIAKLIAIFEILCFEKITMLTKEELRKLMKTYFKEESLISITSCEFIYVGIKTDSK